MEIYVVKSGDTIWQIAKKFGVSAELIISLNGLVDPGQLVVGQALLILFPESVYTVQSGDTLSSVSRKTGASVISLLQNNPSVVQNSYLYPGQTLVISYKNPKDGSVSINGYAYPYINRQVLRRTLPYLTMLTIFGYGISESGDLISIDDEPLIKMANEYKVAPVMLLSSITEDGTFNGERASFVFNTPSVQDILIEKIINIMKQKGYLGLDIDFEYIAPQDAQAYIDFVANVTRQLNANSFFVNVDLAPKTSAQQRGLLYEAHRYGELAEAANTVLLMTYEWGYTYGPPMAVAPLNKVEEVVNYALTEIPPDKIFMGIPNYGYDWLLPFRQGISRATSLGNDYAVTVARKNNAEIMFDEIAQSPHFEYWDAEGRHHVVWFEDVRSINAKYDLISEKSLLGAGYWNIMRLFVPNWSLVNARFSIRKIV